MDQANPQPDPKAQALAERAAELREREAAPPVCRMAKWKAPRRPPTPSLGGLLGDALDDVIAAKPHEESTDDERGRGRRARR